MVACTKDHKFAPNLKNKLLINNNIVKLKNSNVMKNFMAQRGLSVAGRSVKLS